MWLGGSRHMEAGLRVWSGFCSRPLAAGHVMNSLPTDLYANRVSITNMLESRASESSLWHWAREIQKRHTRKIWLGNSLLCK